MAVRDDKLSALCGDKVARVILLAPPDQPDFAELDAILAPYGKDVLRVHNPLAAFAELALQDRLESTRSAWGLSAAGITCLVVVKEAARGDLPLIARAASRYLARVAVMQCDTTHPNPWRVVLTPSAAADSPHPFRRVEQPQRTPPGSAIRERPPEPPPLRLVNSGDASRLAPLAPEASDRMSRQAHSEELPDGFAADGSERDDEPVPSVTREEIAMLLGGEVGDEDEAGSANRGAAP